MKTLVVIANPNLEDSLISKLWISELEKYPDRYIIHNLYSLYPNEKIDVEKEQLLLETCDKIIFQFPFYWFSCPAFFKKWLDEVLSYGWAHGRDSEYKLAGKKIALGITAGIEKKEYCASGRYKYTIEQLTVPFEITFNYMKADYKSVFAFYGVHNATRERMEKSAEDYVTFIECL